MRFCKIVLLLISSCMFLQCYGKNNQEEALGAKISDSQRFAPEYPLVGKDNIFIYKTAGETADILVNGRGIVF